MVGGRPVTPSPPPRSATDPSRSAARRRSGAGPGRGRGGQGDRVVGRPGRSVEPVPPLVVLVDVEQDAVGHRGRPPAVLVDPAADADPVGATRRGEPARCRTPTTTWRPPSSGRLSDQYDRPPSAWSPPRLTLPAATTEADHGDGHHPKRPASPGAGVGLLRPRAAGSPLIESVRYPQ